MASLYVHRDLLQRHAILVLGMHRGRTSGITGALVQRAQAIEYLLTARYGRQLHLVGQEQVNFLQCAMQVGRPCLLWIETGIERGAQAGGMPTPEQRPATGPDETKADWRSGGRQDGGWN